MTPILEWMRLVKRVQAEWSHLEGVHHLDGGRRLDEGCHLDGGRYLDN